MKLKKVLALALAAVLLLSACGNNQAQPTETKPNAEATTAAAEETKAAEVKTGDLPTITLYPGNSKLFSGLVTGWRGDYFAENGFQMEVWSYAEDKTNAMMASGDLPDMMYVSGGQDMLETLIETGKIINLDDYKDQLPHYYAEPYYEGVTDEMQRFRDEYSAGTGDLYVMPFYLGRNDAQYSLNCNFDLNVPQINWAAYEKIGCPEITDDYQLLDVIEQMLEATPEHEDGTKMTGIMLCDNPGSSHFQEVICYARWHGMDNNFYQFGCERNMIDGSIKPLWGDDSVYKAALKWLNEAYKRGLVNEDAVSTPFSETYPKVDKGYCMFPAGSATGWPDIYHEVFIPSHTYYKNEFNNISEIQWCIAINAESEHIDECLKFLDMLADREAMLNILYGPEGDIWEKDGNTLKITDRFATWLTENGGINNYPMSDGTEWALWNTSMAPRGGAIPGYVGTDGNSIPVNPTNWPDAKAIIGNQPNWTAWQKSMDATGLYDYANKNGITIWTGDVFDGNAWPEPDDTQKLTISAVNDAIIEASWKCIYAKDDAEFESIWAKMAQDVEGLGAQDIVDWIVETYKPTKSISNKNN